MVTSSKKSRDLDYYFGLVSDVVPHSCKVSKLRLNWFSIYEWGLFQLFNIKKIQASYG